MKGLKESFQLIYSNTHLRTRETLPLNYFKNRYFFHQFGHDLLRPKHLQKTVCKMRFIQRWTAAKNCKNYISLVLKDFGMKKYHSAHGYHVRKLALIFALNEFLPTDPQQPLMYI